MRYPDTSRRETRTARIRIRFRVDDSSREELNKLARKSHRSISGVLREAIREHIARRRIRPDVLRHLEDSMKANERLGRLLAR